jgi:hypothetical protein
MIIDPNSPEGQRIIRNSAYEQPLTQGDPPPTDHRPLASLTEAELLEMFTAELMALDDVADGWPLLELPPLSVMMLVSLVQLAGRHPGLTPAHRDYAAWFLKFAREYFAESPAALEVLRRGDDPRHDRPQVIAP